MVEVTEMADKDNQSTRLGNIGSVLTIIQFVFPIFTGFVAHLLNASLYLSVGIAVVCFVICITLLKFFRHSLMLHLLESFYYLLAPRKNWTCRDKVIEYTYKDRETLTLRVEYKVKLTSNSCKEIPDKLKWSAGEVDKISSVVSGQEIIPVENAKKDDIQAHLGYQDFLIRLPKVYTKSDPPFPTGFKCDALHDPQHKAMTCLIAGIYQKTNKITLRVRFSKSLNVRNIRKLKFADFLDNEHYDCERGELKLDEAQEFHYVEFSIKRPISGGKYAIDWDFQE